MGASNLEGNIGQSAVGNGSKISSDCESANNAWNVRGSGALNYNNNKNNNNFRVRPLARAEASATFPEVYGISFSSIIEAWMDCERRKKTSNSCIKFRWHVARDLVELWEQMCTATYRPKASMTFVVTYPVLREVWAGAFRDRVAHHWETLRFYPIIEKFIVESGNNSMNCRKGYGNLKAIALFEKMLYDYTQAYTRDDCYIVGGDFANYFMSIDKDLLWSFLEQLIMDEYTGDDKAALLYMMHSTLMHKCQENFYRRSPESMWKDLPPRKSLFHMNGLPIGNLPSQLWANFLGSIFMHYVMYVKGYKDFILFVDDWRLLVRSTEEGRRVIADFKKFLSEQLHVTLHPDKVYLQHYTKGTKMIGSVVKPGRNRLDIDGWLRAITFKTLRCDWGYQPKPMRKSTPGRTYISNRTRGHFISTMIMLNKEAAGKTEGGRIAMLQHLRASINSYLGMMIHHRSYKVRRRICEKYIVPMWGKYLYFAEDYSKCSLRPQYDKIHVVRRKLKSHKYAAKFIRSKYME